MRIGETSEAITLRPWKDSDREPFAAMNADLEVMRYFPALLSAEESAASLERYRRDLDENGWGNWAVEVEGVFAGFTGLSCPTFLAPFTSRVEIAWRFRRQFWGRGLAARAAREVLRFGFDILDLTEILSFTAAVNVRSRRLMERLGLERDLNGDFDHPALPEGHILRRHVLYRAQSRESLGRTEERKCQCRLLETSGPFRDTKIGRPESVELPSAGAK